MSKSALALIAIVAFLVFMVAMTPAALVYNTLRDNTLSTAPDIAISNVEGSIWKGRTDVQFKHFPIITGSWQLSPLHLLAATARSSMTFNAQGLTGNAVIALNSQGGTVHQLSAIVQDTYLNPITVPYGLDLSGEVQLTDVNFGFDQHWLTAAEGKLNWNGGIVHIQTPEKIHTVNLPALEGLLSQENQTVKLDIYESGNPLMQIEIEPDGWARVAINYALVDLANLPLPVGNGARINPAIIVEEKIL